MAIARLAAKSLWNRRTTAALTVLTIALSVALLLGVEKLRRDARDAFANTISGTDLIVGARSGTVQLLLYSVFRIGNATNNMSHDSYEAIAAWPNVKWAVPLSLGDSHRGFRVLGTTKDYFKHYRYANKQTLRLAEGKAFEGVFGAVLGADVARDLEYEVGDSLVLAHGAGRINLIKHDDMPFQVSGILAPTGTPVDRTVHVALEGIEAIHADWKNGTRTRGLTFSSDPLDAANLKPQSITAFLLGLDSKFAIFSVQRRINEFADEPILAILPGVALQELWDLMGVAERLLRAVSVMVVVTGLLGMLTVSLASLEARRREMAVLRSVGARPIHIFALLMSEAGILAVAGAAIGTTLLYGVIAVGRDTAARDFGLQIPLTAPNEMDMILLAAVVLVAFLAGSVPAIRAYRVSLSDGLSVKI
ncbi:MAG: putative ABC transport system permease protein [Gammaproteobacteria bacterium]|jgi:putative ABC transport system permease protein